MRRDIVRVRPPIPPRRWASLLAVTAVLAGNAGAVTAATVQGDLRIFVLNIGQGDAILVVCPHGTHRLLIDSGANNYTNSKAAFQVLLPALLGGDDKLAVVVASHPHADHVASLEWVLSTFKVKKFIDNGKAYTKSFKKIRTKANALTAQGKLDYFRADKFPPPSVADFCPASNVKAELLVPNDFGKAHDMNDNSVVVLVRYNGLKFLFTGDAQKVEEDLLLKDPQVAQKLQGAVFYKLGHHGAETSSTERLVAAIDPRVVAVSSGCKGVWPNKGYRHPRAAVLNRLLTRMAAGTDRSPAPTTDAGLTPKGKWTTVSLREQIYATGIDGTIEVVSDGTTVTAAPAALPSPIGTCP